MGRVNGHARSTELTYKTNDIKFCTLSFHRFKRKWMYCISRYDFMVRNYDYHPAHTMGDIYYSNHDGGLAQIGPTSRVTGRMDGMNEAGLTMLTLCIVNTLMALYVI